MTRESVGCVASSRPPHSNVGKGGKGEWVCAPSSSACHSEAPKISFRASSQFQGRHLSPQSGGEFGALNFSELSPRSGGGWGALNVPRGSQKLAVVVGINYLHVPEIMLQGASNDAHLFSSLLVNTFDFNPHNIVLLTDSLPNPCYRSPALHNALDEERRNASSRQSNLPKPAPTPVSTDQLLFAFSNQSFGIGSEHSGESDVDPSDRRLPTRQNILISIHWMVNTARPGDVIVFYYAGHGCQVNNLNGWEGEGYDEALVPIDANANEENNVITIVQLKKLLLSVPETVQVTIIFDSNGGQTILDSTTLGRPWQPVKGIKQKGFWPLITDVTDKVSRAKYNPSVWKDRHMSSRFVRPRFLPGIDVSNTDDLIDPTFQKRTSANLHSKSYLLAAAPHSQCAVEALMPSVVINWMKPSVSAISGPWHDAQQFRFNPSPGDPAAPEPDASHIHTRFTNPPATKRRANVIHGVFTWALVTATQDIITKSAKNGVVDRRVLTYERVINEAIRVVRSIKKYGLQRLDQVPALTVHNGNDAKQSDIFLLSARGPSPYQPHPDTRSRSSSKAPPLMPRFVNQGHEKLEGLQPAPHKAKWSKLSSLPSPLNLTSSTLHNPSSPPSSEKPISCPVLEPRAIAMSECSGMILKSPNLSSSTSKKY
eukprot:GHVN01004447.1.p1 GENE.GHVN01004447.1~~GHVN01004447.1.p1  ORF type:complete len:654 (+),score=67.09 GHVN01004447.1:170-2131(+)